MHLRHCLLFALVFTAIGCAHFTPQPLDPARNAARLSGRKLAAKTWTLSALAAEAAKNAPDVEVARAQYATARAAIRSAGERPNPTIAVSPAYVFNAAIEGTYGVDFDWTVETAGKRSKRLAVAHENVRAAAARVIDATWKARVAVRKALLELYASEQRAKLLGDAVAQQDQLLKLLNDRVVAGSESSAVVAQPRLLQAQLRLQVSDAARGAALARASLAEALGISTGGLSGVKFSFAPFEGLPGNRTAHRRAALTHRADVLAALADYAAAEATLRLEISRQYPDIHLNPGYALDSNVNKWTLGIGLTLPILNHNEGAIGEAEAKRKEAAAKFNAVQAKVLADVDRADAAVRAARAKIAVTDELLAEQGKQLASEQRMVAAGEGDKLALLSAQVERATTLTSRLDALVELQAALGALEEATQAPLDR